MQFGVVVIGRNEGERLKKCLGSISPGTSVIYVDSGSTDGSPQWARSHGVDVIDLDTTIPFTAARARNVGFRRLMEACPDLAFVQFVDGDCELRTDWPEHATSFLSSHPDVAAVTGRLRERHPERSVYNWLCDREWDRPPGEMRECGGIMMMRTSALAGVHGYREDLIAGEEPELCVRLRAARWRLWRLDTEMALHDANLTRFAQWWRRATRGGYSFALGAHLHGALPERHRVWEARRAWLWGLWLPLACIAASVLFRPLGLLIWLIYPLQILRQSVRNKGTFSQRVTLAFFQVLSRFPETCGQIGFLIDRLLRRQTRLIEYK